MNTELIVFDLDGTLSVNSDFYRSVYSGTLESLIEKERGKAGLDMLEYCRKNYEGKGELALFALNIPFRKWAQLLIDAPMDLLAPNNDLCAALGDIKAIKVIYTGSPVEMAKRILQRIGFNPDKDFDLIIGWQEPELFPCKWACSPLIFQGILQRFSVSPEKAFAVGDMWDTDLMPAQAIGIKTAMVRKSKQGNPDIWIAKVEDFIEEINK